MFFFSTSHPLRALFSPQVRLTERAECLVMPASCVQSDSAWRESLHLACTMVCQYTSLCVPVFYDTSHPAGIMSHSSGMHVRTGASHKRRCTGDRAMQVFPTPVAIPPLCQGLRCVRGDRQILSCILYRYHTSFCMPVSDMHIVQLSHFILHACFSSTSHPLRSLFNPQARLTQGGQRLGSECQHRVCTLLQHMVWHNLVSESGCRDRQRLACTIVCYYTSLCVPVFQIRHNRQGGTYCSLCIRACARRQCSRSHSRC